MLTWGETDEDQKQYGQTSSYVVTRRASCQEDRVVQISAKL